MQFAPFWETTQYMAYDTLHGIKGESQVSRIHFINYATLARSEWRSIEDNIWPLYIKIWTYDNYPKYMEISPIKGPNLYNIYHWKGSLWGLNIYISLEGLKLYPNANHIDCRIKTRKKNLRVVSLLQPSSIFISEFKLQYFQEFWKTYSRSWKDLKIVIWVVIW